MERFGQVHRTRFWNLLSCFSPLTAPHLAGYGDVKTQTPLYFHPKQRVGFQRISNPDLSPLFSRDEFDDVVARICGIYAKEDFRPSAELLDYVWELTSGHPSAVQAVLTELA